MNLNHLLLRRYIAAILFMTLFIFGCGLLPNTLIDESIITPTPINTDLTTMSFTNPSAIPTQSPAQNTGNVTTTTSVTSEAKGCKQPSDNDDLLEINGHHLNLRTFEMLSYAKTLYGGQIDITGDAITQGSYTNTVEASFGTHAGGGSVDLSVMAPGTYTILYDDIDPLIQALRLAGFAAWFRDFNELYDGSPVHIHAIAIGDRSLSLAAREQLAGPFGYFWGYNGLPTENKIPVRDPYGGPIVCDWMIALGYPNKTATPFPAEP